MRDYYLDDDGIVLDELLDFDYDGKEKEGQKVLIKWVNGNFYLLKAFV
jgi:hypothetical protein